MSVPCYMCFIYWVPMALTEKGPYISNCLDSQCVSSITRNFSSYKSIFFQIEKLVPVGQFSWTAMSQMTFDFERQ